MSPNTGSAVHIRVKVVVCPVGFGVAVLNYEAVRDNLAVPHRRICATFRRTRPVRQSRTEGPVPAIDGSCKTGQGELTVTGQFLNEQASVHQTQYGSERSTVVHRTLQIRTARVARQWDD